MIFAADLVTILTTNPEGIGSITFTLNGNVFTTSKQSVPKGLALHIQEYGGANGEWTQNDTKFPAFIKPAAAITCTGDTPALGWELADTAYQIICRVRNQLIGVNWYRRIQVTPSQPIDIGLDQYKQTQWRINVMGDLSRRN